MSIFCCSSTASWSTATRAGSCRKGFPRRSSRYVVAVNAAACNGGGGDGCVGVGDGGCDHGGACGVGVGVSGVGVCSGGGALFSESSHKELNLYLTREMISNKLVARIPTKLSPALRGPKASNMHTS